MSTTLHEPFFKFRKWRRPHSVVKCFSLLLDIDHHDDAQQDPEFLELMLPLRPLLKGTSCLFQQDNARAHFSHVTPAALVCFKRSR